VATGQGTFFDARFLGLYAGPIMSDPTTALVELVANAWDAYATKVDIRWPNRREGRAFGIRDNGIGMSPQDFDRRWRTIFYNRADSQGLTVQAPKELPNSPARHVYGRNGKGRTAGFSFSSPYRVRTWRDGHEAIFLVRRGATDPIDPKLERERDNVDGHGTEITGVETGSVLMSAEQARAALSTRFLTDPAFEVSVDGVRVTFDDIPTECLDKFDVHVPDFGTASVMAIDSQSTDRTARQHGIAWWVNRRLVGKCGWRGSDEEKIIDGRTEEAKRFTFIVVADFLAQNSIEADWSDFKADDLAWQATQPLVQEAVRKKFGEFTAERRAETSATVKQVYRRQVDAMPLVGRARWARFLDTMVDQCPGIGEKHITQLMGILANLELAQSQYAILEKFHALVPNDFDGLNSILETWTVQSAQVALDVIRDRLRLIEEIRARAADPNSDEVQQLQPLFKRGLWVFGPQFEAMEYTSNQSMTTVVKKLFQSKVKASRNRPDFAITPDSSVGCYSLPSWDTEFNESGTSSLVIVELKRPGVPIGTEQTEQVWTYVKELRKLGYLTAASTVTGFVLGNAIAQYEEEDVNRGKNVTIHPMLYETFLGRAEKRMLTLHKKLAETPMMQAAIAEFAAVPAPPQGELTFIPKPRAPRVSRRSPSSGVPASDGPPVGHESVRRSGESHKLAAES
jgi:Histidine kinase-, DNA gyrase B-, and HSP90-like ATPase